MAEVDLASCPDCEADLRRARGPGRCSACGFEFDEHTRVWQSRGSAPRRTVVYGLAGLTVGLAVTLGYRGFHGESPNTFLPIVAGLAATALGLLMDRLLSGRLSGRFVAVTGRGIVVGVRRRHRLIPWEDTGQVKVRGRAPKIEQLSTATLVALEDVFEDAGEVAAFRQAVADGRRRYREATRLSAASVPADAPARGPTV